MKDNSIQLKKPAIYLGGAILKKSRKRYLYSVLRVERELNLLNWIEDGSIPPGWTVGDFHKAAEDLIREGAASIDCHMNLRIVPPDQMIFEENY